MKRKKKFWIKCLASAVFAFYFFLADKTGPTKSPKGRNTFRDGLVKLNILGFGVVFATFSIVL